MREAFLSQLQLHFLFYPKSARRLGV